MKRLNPNDDFVCIPIINDKGNTVGFLKPVTFDYEILFPTVVSLCSKWRRENPSLSNSIFEITDERTKRWIDNLILKRKDRLLFLIDDLDGNHIGHCAYSTFDFEKRIAELDAFCRGEVCKIPKLMKCVDKAMIRWAKDNLKLEALQLRVNEDNDWSILLHKRCGFEIVSRIPLFKRVLEGEVRWDEDDTRDEKEADKYEFLMRLDREKF